MTTTIEAQAMANRLSRVWGCDEVVTSHHDDGLTFGGWVRGDAVCFELRIKGTSRCCELDYDYWCRFFADGNGSIDERSFTEEDDLRTQQEHQRWFDANRLDFKRKAFLSGINIEATAHEKADWFDMARHELGLSEKELTGVVW